MATAVQRPRLPSLEEMSTLIEQAIQRSAADETEIVWIDRIRGRTELAERRTDGQAVPGRTILVRVIERGRVGSFRTGHGEPGELDNAIRQAVAQSRVREPLAGLPHLPADETRTPEIPGLLDREITELTPGRAGELLRDWVGDRDGACLDWSEARVAVFNSRKVRRSAAVTAVQLSVECGRRAGRGRAVDAARRLADLRPEAVVERARCRKAGRDGAAAPEGPVALLLSPEATISLVDLLQTSFSAKAYYDGTSFLREHLGVQVFDRTLNLRDDGTDPAGLPFPFDFEGTAKRPVDLILDGCPKTPTLDQRQAAVLGLQPTAHAIGGNNARAEHLFLRAGELSEDDLLRAADGGLWVSALTDLDTLEPLRMHFRGRALGVRRIEGGKLGGQVGRLMWEDSLLRALSDLGGLGRSTARRLGRDGFLGGISAPGIVVRGVESLTPCE